MKPKYRKGDFVEYKDGSRRQKGWIRTVDINKDGNIYYKIENEWARTGNAFWYEESKVIGKTKDDFSYFLNTTNPIVANALSVAKNGAYDNYPMLQNFRNTVKTEMTMLIGNINYTIKAIKDDYAAELRGSSNDDEKKTMKDCLDRTVAELESLRNKVAARKSNPMV